MTTIDEVARRRADRPRAIAAQDRHPGLRSRRRSTAPAELLDTFAAIQLELSYAELYAGQATASELTERLASHGLNPWTWDAGISGADGRLLQSDTLFVRR